MWWNDVVKNLVERRKIPWKVLGARDEAAKERCMNTYKEEKERFKGVYLYQRIRG